MGEGVDETRSESCPLTGFCISCTERLCFSSDWLLVIDMKLEVKFRLQYKCDVACGNMICLSTTNIESIQLKI